MSNLQYSQLNDIYRTRTLKFDYQTDPKFPVGTGINLVISFSKDGDYYKDVKFNFKTTSSGIKEISLSDVEPYSALTDSLITGVVDITTLANIDLLIDSFKFSKNLTTSYAQINYTSQLSSSFSNDVKLQNGILSGTVYINKTNTFDSSFNNETFVLFQQIKVNGIAVETKSYPFFIGSDNQITKQISGNYNYPNVTVEIYVWRFDNIPFSTVQTKNLTNQITIPPPPPPTTVPNPPILEIIISSLPNNKLLKWNIDNNAITYSLELFSPSYPNWNILINDFKANTVSSTQYGLNVLKGTAIGNYLFRIRAKNSAGHSNYSNIVEYAIYETISNTIPDPPVLTIIDSFSALQKLLRWNQIPNLTNYNVESSSPVTAPLWISFGDFQVGDSNDIGASLWGLNVVKGTVDGLWKYRIRAKNSIGYSNYSNIVSYTIGLPPDKPKPTDTTDLGIYGKLLGLLFVGNMLKK